MLIKEPSAFALRRWHRVGCRPLAASAPPLQLVASGRIGSHDFSLRQQHVYTACFGSTVVRVGKRLQGSRKLICKVQNSCKALGAVREA